MESGTIDRKWLLIRLRPFMYGDRGRLGCGRPAGLSDQNVRRRDSASEVSVLRAGASG